MTYRKLVITVLVSEDDAECVAQEMSVLLERLQDQLCMPSAEINESEMLEALPAECDEWVRAQAE